MQVFFLYSIALETIFADIRFWKEEKGTGARVLSAIE